MRYVFLLLSTLLLGFVAAGCDSTEAEGESTTFVESRDDDGSVNNDGSGDDGSGDDDSGDDERDDNPSGY